MSIGIRVSGAWKDVSAVSVRVGGAWKTVSQAYVRTGGVWEELMGRGPAALIDRTTGSTITNADARPGAGFDGTTSQTDAQATFRNNAGAGLSTLYYGKTTAVPTAIESVRVYGTSNLGFCFNSNPSITITLYGKQGTAPSSGTNGTSLGSTTFTDTNNESGGRTINSSDTATYWDHVWVNITQATNANMMIAELEMTGWIT
jgi:hypothetical protein